MSRRVSEIIVLAEDDPQFRLVRRCIDRAFGKRPPIRERRFPTGKGSGEHWVRTQFPIEVGLCRQRNTKAATLLVAVIDADAQSVSNRKSQLENALEASGRQRIEDSDPIAVLIPKRHIETWLHCLLSNIPVDEKSDYKNREIPPIKPAAEVLYAWTRKDAAIPERCVDSLRVSLPEWRKIGRPSALS